MENEVMQKLREPFDFRDVEWKIQVTTQDKARGMAVAYIDSRAIQRRLDEALGATNWKNEFIPWQGNSQLCGLSIFDSERGEWVTKYDGAECTDIEPVKGGLSDSFKRAACVWGIGRYLYELGGIWVEVEQRGKSSYIKDNQYPRLEIEYNKSIAQMFNIAQPEKKQEAPAAPAKEKVVPIAAAPAPIETLPVETLPVDDIEIEPVFTVQSVRPSGEKSQLLQLVSPVGEVIAAYVQKGDDSIQSGTKLKDVNIIKKNSAYGEYNLINTYKVAA